MSKKEQFYDMSRCTLMIGVCLLFELRLLISFCYLLWHVERWTSWRNEDKRNQNGLIFFHLKRINVAWSKFIATTIYRMNKTWFGLIKIVQNTKMIAQPPLQRHEYIFLSTVDHFSVRISHVWCKLIQCV